MSDKLRKAKITKLSTEITNAMTELASASKRIDRVRHEQGYVTESEIFYLETSRRMLKECHLRLDQACKSMQFEMGVLDA